MKGFQFKTKEVVRDEDLLKHKNFNEVLHKHQTISKSYKLVWKIWGGIGLAAIIGFVSFIGLSAEETTIATNQLLVSSNIEQIKITKSVALEVIPVTEIIMKEEVPNQITTIVKNIPHILKKPVNKTIEPVVNIDTIVTQKASQTTIEEFFHLQQKTPQERVQLPTLFVAGKPWPTMITKRELIKQSNLTAQYRGVNKEVPIISYTMMRVNPDDYEKEHKKTSNVEGRYSAAILREAHRSTAGEFIIYENIIVFIPGIGRMSLGDLKVEVVDDKTYNKRLRERKLITD